MLQSIGLGLQCEVYVKSTRSESRNDDEESVLCDTEDRLAFKRIGSNGFRICMVHEVSYKQTDKYGEEDWIIDVDASYDTPWKNLSRREKIEAASKLPDLLRKIADEAHQAIKGYDAAAQAIEEVINALPKAGNTTTIEVVRLPSTPSEPKEIEVVRGLKDVKMAPDSANRPFREIYQYSPRLRPTCRH